MDEGLTEAQRWALAFIVANAGAAPHMIGQHMSDRPGMKRKGSAKLTKAQGFGRLGASMAALLRKKGLVRQAPAHPTGPTYTATYATTAGVARSRAEGI